MTVDDETIEKIKQALTKERHYTVIEDTNHTEESVASMNARSTNGYMYLYQFAKFKIDIDNVSDDMWVNDVFWKGCGLQKQKTPFEN